MAGKVNDWGEAAAWDALKKASLTEKQKERIRDIAIQYVREKRLRGFRPMCLFIRRISNASFQRKVERLANYHDPEIRRRARVLLAYLESPEKGERAHREFHYGRA